jgi:hypothetical protein
MTSCPTSMHSEVHSNTAKLCEACEATICPVCGWPPALNGKCMCTTLCPYCGKTKLECPSHWLCEKAPKEGTK